jgi:hypothetical protein
MGIMTADTLPFLFGFFAHKVVLQSIDLTDKGIVNCIKKNFYPCRIDLMAQGTIFPFGWFLQDQGIREGKPGETSGKPGMLQTRSMTGLAGKHGMQSCRLLQPDRVMTAGTIGNSCIMQFIRCILLDGIRTVMSQLTKGGRSQDLLQQNEQGNKYTKYKDQSLDMLGIAEGI